MQNKKNMSADVFSGVICKDSDRSYLDTGIGLHIDLDESSVGKSPFMDIPADDDRSGFWNDIRNNISDTNRLYEDLEDAIRTERTLKMSLAEGQEQIIEEFRRRRQKLDYLYLNLENYDIRFKVHVGLCTMQELHNLFKGEKIAVKCVFEGLNLTLLKTDMDIIVTPIGRPAVPEELIPGQTYTGYVKNWTLEDGLFIYCEGHDGLLKGTTLKGAGYKDDFKAGRISEEYPIASSIEICVLGIDKKGDKTLINMVPKGSATVKEMADIGQVLTLPICAIYPDKAYMMVNHLGHRCLVIPKGAELVPFKQRVGNKVYYEGKKIRVRVHDKDVESGKISFTLVDIFEDYGIRTGDTLPAQIRNGELHVIKDGREWHFDMAGSINMSYEMHALCKDTPIDVMAECIEIMSSGEPRFSIDLPIRKYLSAVEDGSVIEARIIGSSERLVAWQYDSIFGGIRIEEAGFMNAIPASFTKGQVLRLKVSNPEEGEPSVTFADPIENPWDEVSDLKAGDEISVELLEHRQLDYGHCFRYRNVTGIIGTKECPKAENGHLTVKVAHIDTSRSILCALPSYMISDQACPTGKTKVTVLKYIGPDLFWAMVKNQIYAARPANDYPKYVQQFLFKENLPVKADIVRSDGAFIEISHSYSHDAISHFTKAAGDEIVARVVGEGPEGFILETGEGLYCLLPFKETGWCSGIHVDHSYFPVGEKISVKITAVDKRCITVSFRDMIEDPWQKAEIKTGEVLDCMVAGRKTKDWSLIVRYGDLYGNILWEDISWFDCKWADRYPAGTSLKATVTAFDPEAGTFRLSMTCQSGNPWDNISLIQDSVYAVTVKEVYEKCAVVTTEEGYEGYIQLANLSHLNHPDCRNVVKNDDVFEARLILLDPDKRRLEFDRRSCIPSLNGDCAPGDTVEATVINIANDGIHLEIKGNPGYIPSVIARQFVKGAGKNTAMKDMFAVGEKLTVKICRKESDILYATHPEGAVYDDIWKRTVCRITGTGNNFFTLETEDGKKVFMPFAKASWSGYAGYEHHIGDSVDVNICGFILQHQEYMYKGERMSLSPNPWNTENHPPETGDLLYATVIAREDSGNTIVSHGSFTAPLSDQHLLTQTPWITGKENPAPIDIKDNIMVRVSEFNGKDRRIVFKPYPDSNGLDKTSCILQARHIAPEGIFAYSEDYDWFCFVPREEIYWSPLKDATGHIDIGEEFVARKIRYDYESGMFIMSIRRLLLEPDRSHVPGNNISGVISRKTSDCIVVNYGDFEGAVNLVEEGLDPAEYSIGQDVTARITSRSSNNGLTCSIKLAKGFVEGACPYRIGEERMVRITSVGQKGLNVVCPEMPCFRGNVTGLSPDRTYYPDTMIKVIIIEIHNSSLKFKARIPMDDMTDAEDAVKFPEKQDIVQVRVVSFSNEEGYIVRYQSNDGLIPLNEMSWQYCDIKYSLWRPGSIIPARYLRTDDAGRMIFSHRRAIRNPFESIVLEKGQEYAASVRRVHAAKRFMVVELTGTGGIEATVEMNSIMKMYPRTLPEPGTLITKVRIDRIGYSKDPTLHGRINVSIVEI